MNEIRAYAAGFIAADGHLNPKGAIIIGIAKNDAAILEDFKQYFGKGSIATRKRNMTIRGYHYVDHEIAVYEFYNKEFVINFAREFNIPFGNKSKTLGFPILSPDMERHYMRGVIDGDGSLGFNKDGRPFISLITASQDFANGYCKFLKRTLGIERTTSPNKRDHAHNILIWSNAAQRLVTYLYQDATITLSRKQAIANDIMLWACPYKRKECRPRRWTSADDEIIISKSIDEAIAVLGRSRGAIMIRKSRLKQPKT